MPVGPEARAGGAQQGGPRGRCARRRGTHRNPRLDGRLVPRGRTDRGPVLRDRHGRRHAAGAHRRRSGAGPGARRRCAVPSGHRPGVHHPRQRRGRDRHRRLRARRRRRPLLARLHRQRGAHPQPACPGRVCQHRFSRGPRCAQPGRCVGRRRQTRRLAARPRWPRPAEGLRRHAHGRRRLPPPGEAQRPDPRLPRHQPCARPAAALGRCARCRRRQRNSGRALQRPLAGEGRRPRGVPRPRSRTHVGGRARGGPRGVANAPPQRHAPRAAARHRPRRRGPILNAFGDVWHPSQAMRSHAAGIALGTPWTTSRADKD